MKWSDIPFTPSNRTLRQFAAGWLVIFSLLGLVQFQLHHRHQLGLILLAGALLVGIPGLFKPRLLRTVFVGWMILAFPIGWTVSMLMLLLLYFVIFTPIGWALRLAGRDVIGRKAVTSRNTYWMPKRSTVDVKEYFRQY